MFDDIRLFISFIDLQITYKLYLWSDKDIEDAVYLWVLFREMLEGISCMSRGSRVELGFDREKNRQERLDFVRKHALRVRRVPNGVWSGEQADLIDAFLANAGSYALSCARYLEMHRALAKRRRPELVDENGSV